MEKQVGQPLTHGEDLCVHAQIYQYPQYGSRYHLVGTLTVRSPLPTHLVSAIQEEGLDMGHHVPST